MKKFLAIFLSFVMVFQVVGYTWAEEPQEEYTVTFVDAQGQTHELTFSGTLYAYETGEYKYAGDIFNASFGEEAIYAYPQDDGSVVIRIDGSISGSYSAVDAYGNSVIIISGDVTGEDYGLRLNDGAKAQVGGNVDSQSVALWVYDGSDVSVGGKVSAGKTYEYDSTAYDEETGEWVVIGTYTYGEGTAIMTYGDAAVEVDGDVASKGAGVIADSIVVWDEENGTDKVENLNESNIVINGSLYAENGNGITTDGNPSVTVNGDIVAKGYGSGVSDGPIMLYSENDGVGKYDYVLPNSEITINGDVSTELGAALHISGNSKATVNGNVSIADSVDGNEYYGYAIETNDSPVVTVTGDVYGGIDTNNDYAHDWTTEVDENDRTAVITVEGSLYGDINAKGSPKITVGGELSSGTSDSYGVAAVTQEFQYYDETGLIYDEQYYRTNAEITIEGDLTAKADGILAEGTSDVTVEGDVKTGRYDQSVWEYDEETGEYEIVGTESYGGDGIRTADAATVTVKGDLVAEGDGISSQKEYRLNKETLEFEDAGNHSVITVQGSVTAKDGQGIYADGDAQVTVGGSLEASQGGVIALDNADVTIGGNMKTGEGTAIRAEQDAHVSVEGSLETDEWGIIASDGADITIGGKLVAEQGHGVYTTGDSTVVVGGDIVAGETGVNAPNETDWIYSDDGTSEMIIIPNESKVTVEGGITAGSDGVYADGKAQVSVDGDIKAGNNGVIAQNSEFWTWDPENEQDITYFVENEAVVIVNGGVEASGYHGVLAEGKAQVTVNGDLSAGYTYVADVWEYDEDGNGHVVGTKIDGEGYGVRTTENATVLVDGDVISQGDGIVSYNAYRYDTHGILTETVAADSDIKVTGDVNAVYGEGAFVEGNTTLEIGGSVTAGEHGVRATDNSVVTVGGDITNGSYQDYSYWWTDDNGTRHHEQGTDPLGSGVYTEGASKVTVKGNVTSVGNGIVSYNTFEDSWTYTYPEDGGWIETYNGKVADMSQNVVSVDGDVISTGTTGIYVEGQANISVGGNVQGTEGISAYDDTVISVGGDVTADKWSAINAMNSNHGNQSVNIYDEEGKLIDSYYESTDPYENSVRINVDGNVTGYVNGIYANGNAEISVGGNVTGHETGINANGNAEINVGGDVNGGYLDEYGYSGDAINVSDNATVNVGGDVNGEGWAAIQVLQSGHWDEETDQWVYDDNDCRAEVNVAGDVNGYGAGIQVGANADITVGGDVTAELAHGLMISDEGKDSVIMIEGDVNGGDFVWPDFESPEQDKEDPYIVEQEELQKKIDALFDDVEVEVVDYHFGAVQITDEQIEEAESKDATGSIVIQGSVNAKGESDAYVVDIYVDEGADVEIPDLPSMTVYELNTENGGLIDVNVYETYTRTLEENNTEYTRSFLTDIDEEQRTTIEDAIAATIKYIIEVVQPENGSIEMTGATYDEASDNMVAEEGDDLSVTLNVDKGYRLDGVVNAGTKATVVDNGDGTWTITVQRGGGVTITANIVLCTHEWKTLTEKQATCTEDGFVDRQCQLCGIRETVNRPAFGHAYPDVFISNGNGTHSAKCEHECGVDLTYKCEMDVVEIGSTRISTCKVCGYSVTEENLTENDTEVKENIVAPETEGVITDTAVVEKVTQTVIDKMTTQKEGYTVVTVQIPEVAFEEVPVEAAEGEEAVELAPIAGTLVVYEKQIVADEILNDKQAEIVGESTHVYHVALVSEGQNVQLDRKITIKLPVKEEEVEALSALKLVLIAEDGTMIEIPFEIIDGEIVFSTEYLGIFTFVDEEALLSAMSAD